MNMPIPSSASGFVISQRTLASHTQNAMPQIPNNTITSQMTVPSHHPNSGPHQQAANNIQFAQSVASLPGLVQQQPTVLQTMSTSGLQYPQQQLMIQGQILQPIYQQGAQQPMLMAPQGNFALQQSINQGIAMMQASANHKVQQAIPIQPGKQMVAKSSGPNQALTAGPNQVMMSSPSQQMLSAAPKISVVNHKHQQNAMAVAGTAQTSMTITSQSQAPPAMSGQSQASSTISVTGPTQTNQITVSTPHPHPQYLAQPSADGRTVFIPMLSQPGSIVSTHQDLSNTPQQQQHQQQHQQPNQQQQLQKQQQQQQPQQQQQQQQQQVSVAHAPQILTSNNNQTVNLGQPHIVNSLQAFNAFANGLSWAPNQLQGNQVLQSPIQLFRNQQDGSFYFGSAPAAAATNQQHVQQQQQQHPVTSQAPSSIGITKTQATTAAVHGVCASGNLNSTTNVQPVTAVTNQPMQQSQLAAGNQAQLASRVSMTPPISSAGNGSAVMTSTASVEPSVIQSVSNALSASSAAAKETPRLTPGPWNHPQPFRISRPQPPLQHLGLKVTVVPRSVRGIIPRPPRQNPTSLIESSKNKTQNSKQSDSSASRSTAYDFSEESSDSTPPLSKFLMKTVKSNAAELSRDVALAEKAEQPLVATVPPLDSSVQQPVNTALPVAGVPEISDTCGSTSPAIAATFPSENSDLPESHEEASEILTHIVEGFVIREGPVPFPVTRTALLNEILAREQMVMQNIKERKRKHESAVAASNARKPGTHEDSTVQIKGAAQISGRNGSTQSGIAGASMKTAQAIPKAPVVNAEIKIESAKLDPNERSRNPLTSKHGGAGDDDDATNIVSVIDNVMNSKNLGLSVSPPSESALKTEKVSAGADRSVVVTRSKPSSASESVKRVGQTGNNDAYKDCYTYISGNTERNPLPNNVTNKGELQEKEKGQQSPVSASIIPSQRKSDNPAAKSDLKDESSATDPEIGSFNTHNPLTWTVEEVSEFIKTIPGCAMYAEEFRSQEIDGEAMLFLKVEHLMTRLNIKLGPAAKICARLKQLQGEVSS